jgi:chromosome segregation protein
MSGLEAEVTRLPAEMADVSRAIEQLDAQVEELLDERRRAERTWQQLKVELEQREAAYQDLVQQQRERAVLRQRVREEMARLEQEEARYQERRLRILDELAALEGTVSELSDQLTAVRSQKLAVRQRQEEDRRRADEMEARVTELERRQRLLESEERKMGQRMEAWRQELVAIQVRYEGYEPSDGVEPLTPLEEDKARQTLTRLKEELTLLGPVSPGSLALYEALKARYEFLQQERRDVVDARSELEATLKDIDRETEHRVRETKERVEARFRLAVQRLYGGGDGGFEWIAGDPPGIDVWVKPPGKRPGHLGLLSGGEKALGGIAWLFSLLSVRRAPFVVLDEVEASLDEASAARFAQYLKESDASVQYVIVTHHRQTMEAADVLWGVAADAEGQSRLISVKLEATDAVGAT